MTCIGDAPQHVERAVGRRHHGHGVARRGARADWGERGPGAVGGTVHVAVVERIELFGACTGRPGQDRMSLDKLQYASFFICSPGPLSCQRVTRSSCNSCTVLCKL
jgi:hypothetical protein